HRDDRRRRAEVAIAGGGGVGMSSGPRRFVTRTMHRSFVTHPPTPRIDWYYTCSTCYAHPVNYYKETLPQDGTAETLIDSRTRERRRADVTARRRSQVLKLRCLFTPKELQRTAQGCGVAATL